MAPHRRLAALLLVPVFLGAFAVIPAAAQPTGTSSDSSWHAYFPLEIGNVWQYEYEYTYLIAFRDIQTIEWTVVGASQAGDTLFFAIEAICEEVPAEHFQDSCAPGDTSLVQVYYNEELRTVMERGPGRHPCSESFFNAALPFDVNSDTLLTTSCGELDFRQFEDSVDIGDLSYPVAGFNVGIFPGGYRFGRGLGLLDWGGCEGECWEGRLTYARIGDESYGTYRHVPAGLHLTTTSPASGAAGVDVDSVAFTFNARLDTSALPALLVRPVGTDAASARFTRFGNTLVLDAPHEPDRDYTWVISGAEGDADFDLIYPQILRYTTAPTWGDRTVSGSVSGIILTAGGDGIPDVRQSVVALLTRPPTTDPATLADLTSEDVAAAAPVAEDHTYTIERVRPGTYWPVALLDADHDGDADVVSNQGDLQTIEIATQDVEHVDLLIVLGGSTEQPERAGQLSLSAPYPNPATGPVHLTLTVDRPATTVEVFDVLGRRVAVLYRQSPLTPGDHPIVWDSTGHAPGTYFVRATTGGQAQTTAVIVP